MKKTSKTSSSLSSPRTPISSPRPGTPALSKSAASPRTTAGSKLKVSSSSGSVLTTPPAPLKSPGRSVLKSSNSESSLMSQLTSPRKESKSPAKSPRSKTPEPAARSKSPAARSKSPARSPRETDGLGAENANLKDALQAAQEDKLAAEAEAALARQEADQANRKAEELDAALREVELHRTAEEAGRQRAEAERDVLREALRSSEEDDDAKTSHHDHRLQIQLAHAQQVAHAAQQEVARLNQMFASFNRHAVGLTAQKGGGYGRVTNDTMERRAAHYRKQPSASYRSSSPRFGKSVELAARGVRAGTNVALGEEQPLLPCPGSNHSNRDQNGNFWATSCTTNAMFDLPVSSLARKLSF